MLVVADDFYVFVGGLGYFGIGVDKPAASKVGLEHPRSNRIEHRVDRSGSGGQLAVDGFGEGAGPALVPGAQP